MTRLNKKGIITGQLVLIILIFVSVAGFAVWNISKSREVKQVDTNTPVVSVKSGEVAVSGSVQFARQGPTDEVVGYEPATATLVIGSEDSLTAWKENPARKSGERLLSELYKPTDVKIEETKNGKFNVILKRNTDIMCIVNPTTLSLTNDAETNETKYGFFDCKRFTTNKDMAKADITLIGFGSNAIKCDESDCKEFAFQID